MELVIYYYLFFPFLILADMPDTVIQDNQSQHDQLIIYLGSGVGGGVAVTVIFFVCILMIVCCMRTRKKKQR